MAAAADDTQFLVSRILAHLNSPADFPHPFMTDERKAELYRKMKDQGVVVYLRIECETTDKNGKTTEELISKYIPTGKEFKN